MVALGRPGVGEDLLRSRAFREVQRVDLPFVWEFADPELYARALASTGPAYEAILQVGEEAFLAAAEAEARTLSRGAATPGPDCARRLSRTNALSGREDRTMERVGFLAAPPMTGAAQAIFDEDVAEDGYVANGSRLWAYQPTSLTGLFDLLREVNSADRLTVRQRGILVAACASTLGDSYCSLAWGSKLAEESDPWFASTVLRGEDEGLDAAEGAMARWARLVACDPNATTEADVEALRAAGFTDSQIFTMTAFVALRLAFSTVNDALGTHPDGALRQTAPEQVLRAVDYGRAPDPLPADR